MAQPDKKLLELFKKSIEGLVEVIPEDYMLEVFLIASNLDLAKAVALYQQYYEQKRRLTGISDSEFKDYKPVQEIAENVSYKLLGNDMDGRVVLWAPVGRWNLKVLIQRGLKDDLYRYFYQLKEKFLLHIVENRSSDGSCNGIGLVDFKELSMMKFSNYETVQLCMEMARVFEIFSPVVLKIYILNAPWAANALLNMVKPVLSKSSVEKLEMFGSEQKKWMAVLKNKIPMEVIPIEYGGLGPRVLSVA